MSENNMSKYNENIKNSISTYIEKNIIDQWLSSLDVSENTKLTYETHLLAFIEWLERNNINNVSKVDILNYKKELMYNYSNATVCLKISILKCFYGYLEDEHICSNIMANIKGAKIVKGFKKDIFSMEQIKIILNSINTSTLVGVRNYALINLLLRTGLRSCEVHRANMEDIRFKDGETVLYVQGKGRTEKDEFVVLTPTLINILNQYFQMREKKQHITDTSPLFISLADNNLGSRLSLFSIRWLVKNMLRDVGIDSKRLTTHSTRHTAITLSLLSGAELIDVKEMARHESIDTTLLYAHNIERLTNAPEKKLEEVYGKCI